MLQTSSTKNWPGTFTYSKMKRKFDICTNNWLSIVLSLILSILICSHLVSALPCPADKWPCLNGIECIDLTSRCNSVVDCGDGSDEGTSCSKKPHIFRIFQCSPSKKNEHNFPLIKHRFHLYNRRVSMCHSWSVH